MQLSILAAASSALLALAPAGALAQCAGTGKGTCTLGISGKLVGTGDISWGDATVYNNKCEILGKKVQINENQAIESKLPWTVVVNELHWNGDYNKIGFCYSKFCFNGYFHCVLGDDKVTNACKHTFPC
ncbi:hypothetical protein B0H63DRAFT_488574 [Podospora didyma]|uniref:Uncharacterized protein n=1 Tax=Podospora didyma TaxID=330526 RepID=A0AAE0K1S1_9PEZI|nr:hypothetical protein B0H63DRAFT_488574 [Podospora didyma]